MEVTISHGDSINIFEISQIVIAIINVIFAFYIFIYQAQNNRRLEIASAQLNEQNIRIQGFKELIIKPNLPFIELFYNKLLIECKPLQEISLLNIADKEKLNDKLKREHVLFRKSFTLTIHKIDMSLYSSILHNHDQLVDNLTEIIFGDTEKISEGSEIYDSAETLILASKSKLMIGLFSYRG